MPASKPRNKGGRPSFRFTDEQIEQLEKLAGLWATRTEAAGWFEIDLRTLNKQLDQDERAAAAWENGLAKGKISLRRDQRELARKNAAMAIFLGKQYLGQRDVVTQEHTGSRDNPVQVEARIILENVSDDDLGELERILADAAGGAPGTGGAKFSPIH